MRQRALKTPYYTPNSKLRKRNNFLIFLKNLEQFFELYAFIIITSTLVDTGSEEE